MKKTLEARNPGVTLVQARDDRELMLERMRAKLAGTPTQAMIEKSRHQDAVRKQTVNWSLRALAVLGLILANLLFLGRSDTILSKLGYSAVPSLPSPSRALSKDEQALYWTYAMFDIGKLQSHFHVQGFYAIDQHQAKAKLEKLLPKVSTETMGEISKYTRVAFRDLGNGLQ